MVMDVMLDALLGSVRSVYTIAIVIIPIMIVLQLMKDYNCLSAVTKRLEKISSLYRVSKESIFPLLVGILFGLAFGAGVIIQSVEEGQMDERDLFLITIFLISCHAVFEDTLIFVAVGANGFLLLSVRLFTAVVLTFILSRTKYGHKKTSIKWKSASK